jgi:DNA repair protein RadC
LLGQAGDGLAPEEQERAFFTLLESSTAPPWDVGPAATSRILAAFELARRYSEHRFRMAPKPLSGPTALTELSKNALSQIPSRRRLAAREWLGFIPYHRNRTLGSLCLIEEGARTHVNADATELFARVLSLRPKAFFLAHNHPSGDLRPSPSDLELTDRVERLAADLGTPLLGHWIVAPSGELELPARPLRRH